jgi:transposase
MGTLNPAAEEDESVRDELEQVTAQLRKLEAERGQWSAERQQFETERQKWTVERERFLAEKQALLAKIELLRQLFKGKTSEKHLFSEAGLFGKPVDASITPAEAETKKLSREERESQREQRKKGKNIKKGRGQDGKKKPINGGGRRPVNQELPPEPIIIPVPATDRFLKDGTPLILLGYEDSEQEYYVSAHLVRLIIRREIMGLADTREEVIRAPIPPAIVARAKYNDSIIVEMMIRKYFSGMPFYRVVQDMRAMGSDLSESQLSDLAQRFATFVSPVVAAIRSQVLAETVAHIDETSLPTQDGGRYLWGILGGNQIFFHVGGRGGNELRNILGLALKEATTREIAARSARASGPGWKIVNVMADGYEVYNTVLKEAGIVRLACWSHGRRKFKPYVADPVLSSIGAAIGVLYQFEDQAKKEVARQELVDEAADAVYTRLRAERSKPQLAKIQRMLTESRGRYPEGSDQRLAIAYILDDWAAFVAYAERGDLPIDNNDCERALRMIVVGRKSWMFIGSEDAAQPAADIFSVMESCRRCRVEPRAYMQYVVERLHAKDTPPEQLTPRAMKTRFPLRM